VFGYSRSSTQEREAMGVKFLARGSNSSRDPQHGIESGTSLLAGQCLSRLLLPPSVLPPSFSLVLPTSVRGKMFLTFKRIGCSSLHRKLVWIGLVTGSYLEKAFKTLGNTVQRHFKVTKSGPQTILLQCTLRKNCYNFIIFLLPGW